MFEKDVNSNQENLNNGSNSSNVIVIDAEDSNIYESHYGPHTKLSQIFTDAFAYFGRQRTTELLEIEGNPLTDELLTKELQEIRHLFQVTGHEASFTVAKGTSGA